MAFFYIWEIDGFNATGGYVSASPKQTVEPVSPKARDRKNLETLREQRLKREYRRKG